MKAFAAFILRGPMQAATVVLAASMLPLLAVVGAGALALVTLRNGFLQGAVPALIAGSVLSLFHWLTLGTAQPALVTVLELWLPVVLLAELLRRSVSLPLTVVAWMGLGMVAVIGFHWMVPDPVAYWRQLLEPLAVHFGGGAPLDAEARAFMEEALLPAMTGLWALSLMAMVLGGLFLGRWWQAVLFNPEGFRDEFYALHLGRGTALVAALVWLASVFTGPGLLYDLAGVLAAGFVLQALSMTHALVAARGWSVGWLVAVYLVMPLLFRPMALVGIGDALFDWRGRLAGRSDDRGQDR